VAIEVQQLLLGGSKVTTVKSTVFESEISGGSGVARSRGLDDWDDEGNEE